MTFYYEPQHGWITCEPSEFLDLAFDRLFSDLEDIITRKDSFDGLVISTYSADPYSDDYSNLDLEEARKVREAAEYEEREFGMFFQELADGGSDLNDPNHYDDDGRFHLITRSEMGYED